MTIAHLERTDCGVFCKHCLTPFGLPSRVLNDPYKLVEAKEAIAVRHSCTAVRAARAARRLDSVRVLRPHSANVLAIDEHWNREVNRLFAAAH